MIKGQLVTDEFAIYNSDSNYVLPTIPSESIDLCTYSPPFRGLYNYSSLENDLSNCETPEQFLQHYEFIVKELSRVTKFGRINAVHCTDIINQNGSNFDFPNEIIKLHEKYGFDYKNRITIWKEPLKVRMRTMVRSLMHKLIVEDSTECFTAMPDYVLIFKKRGTNKVPVTHSFGLTEYAGQMPFLLAHLDTYGLNETIRPVYNQQTKANSMTDAIEAYIQNSFKQLKTKYKDWKDPKTNKLSHIIWQRYASSVWDDIRIDNVLKFKESKDEDDEKHVHPLQLDVYDRLNELYSNPGETFLEPFLGVGSGVYSAVSMGRKAIGIELKDSYFNQAIKNLKEVDRRFSSINAPTLFDTPINEAV